jgi:PEP-CTERM motif
MRRISVILGVALLVLTMSVAAEAATLSIQFTGLDLVFDGSGIFANDIFDAGSRFGGNGDPSQADPLASMNFFIDGALVGSLSSNIFADVGLFGVGDILVGGGTAQVEGGTFDVLTKNAVPGFGLALNLKSLTLTYAGNQLALSGFTSATEIFRQSLPFNLRIGEPIQVLFILGTLSNVRDNGQFLTAFTGSGTGTITGTALPEPATLLMLGAGILGVSLRARRRASGR